jgi:hypothetical protein
MKKYPIQLGTFLFTMVEPHRGHEVEYNRWYERDHFYGGCMELAWNFAGDRFVATKPLQDLRYPAETPMTPDKNTAPYLAIYWVSKGHHDEWNDQSVVRVNELHRDGRMFAERTHIHTALYDFTWSWQATENGTNPELALDRDYAGLVVNVGELAEGKTFADVEAFTSGWADKAKGGAGNPDLIIQGTMLPLLDDAPPDVPRTPNADRRFLQLHFLDHKPDEQWSDGYAEFGDALAASGVGTHLWTAPFIQTVFGTDTYTDQLR